MGAEIDFSAIESSVLESAPQWWREYYLWKYGRSNLRFCIGWNKLVSVSWSFAKIDGRKVNKVVGGVFDLVKLTKDAEGISNWVVENFGMGKYLEVVNKPRVGKSTGVLHGILRLLLEDERFANLGNFTIFVVTPNKRLAANLYRYLVGLLNVVFREAVMNGKVKENVDHNINVEYYLVTRVDLSRKVKIRLYLGGRDSCLLGKEEHYMDRDCVMCKYLNTGKVPYGVPLMDPWMLKVSGYCPFSVSRNKRFVYNSIVVTTLHAFIHYFSWLVPRYRINKVILFLDEVVEIYEKSRVVVRELEVEAWMPKEVKQIVWRWNACIRRLKESLKSHHLKRIKYVAEKLNANISLNTLNIVYTSLLDSLDFEDIKNLRGVMSGLVDELRRLYGRCNDPVEATRLRRLIKRMELMLSWSFVIISHRGNQLERIILRFKNPRRYIRRGRRVEVMHNQGPLSVVSGPASVINNILEMWKKENIVFGVIGTSVVPSMVGGDFITGTGGWKFLLPTGGLMYLRSEINPIRRITGVETIRLWNIGILIGDLLKLPGVDVVILSKEMLLGILSGLREKGVVREVVGDAKRKVLDYVVLEKPNRNGFVYLMYPHGRCSMGVDPPVLEVDRIWVIGGVRRPPPSIVPIGMQDLVSELKDYYNDEVLREMVRMSKYGIRLRQIEGLTRGFCVLHSQITEVYDNWDWLYDVHILRQVVGRWFLSDVKMVIYLASFTTYSVYSGYWDYRLFNFTKVPFYNPKGRNDTKEIYRYLRELARRVRFGVVKDIYWEPAEYEFSFVAITYDVERIIRNLMRRERSLYEAARKIRRSGGEIGNEQWINRVIRSILLYISRADNPVRFKWLKRVYEEKGLYSAYMELLKYLRLENYMSRIKILRFLPDS